ncbi:MAG TPA: hypothetical protein VFH27_09235, partial [Longimicrobiaceae bacterium]|nr:hypothetical protein [Longimicrobiaceae bacterium]
MSSLSSHRIAVDALRLRAWAMPILLADEPPAPPPAVAGPAWELFAEMEWVSQPLRSRLRGAGVWDACDACARGALDRAADLERGRIASARAELRRIGALATEHG